MKKMAVEKNLMSGKYLPCCRHQRAGVLSKVIKDTIFKNTLKIMLEEFNR